MAGSDGFNFRKIENNSVSVYNKFNPKGKQKQISISSCIILCQRKNGQNRILSTFMKRP